MSRGARYRPLDVPDTLQGSLMARLDRLPASKYVAQTGAVIGRDFPHALIAAVADLSDTDLTRALVALADADLVHQRGSPPAAVYSFKHALVRDAAYESLLRSRRQTLHGRIVAAVESDFAHLAVSEPEWLAQHCAGAGLTGKAVGYWCQAGAQAVRRAGNREASEHLRKALAHNDLLPDTPERDRTELAILSQLGPALMSLHGWPAPEVREVFERAGAVARRLQVSADLAPPLVGLWLYHVAKGQFDRADGISDKLFRVAGELKDPEILLQAHHAAWPTCFLRGRFSIAAGHIASAMALYDETRHAQHRYLYLGHDPAVCALAIGTVVQSVLGRGDEVLRMERSALQLARRLRHAPSLAHTLWFVGEAQVARGDVACGAAIADELLALCEEHKLPQPRATALMFKGWALAQWGETAAGLAKVEEGLAIWDGLGARSYLPRDQTLSWMRGKAGTSSLRAILYMDEVFGYLPPVAEPPSKRPLLTLLKQARAFGVGVVLATQNPVDLDYKGLTNIGTWLLGRLQADRDKQRLLDGLEGAAQGKGPSRAELDALLSRLRTRLFLLHNVHEDAPVVFESRWAMSYLRGPLTRQEIRRLTDEDREGTAAAGDAARAAGGPTGAGAFAAGAGGTAAAAGAPAAAATAPPPSPAPAAAPQPLLPPGVVQLWEPARAAGGTYQPALAGWGRVWYRDARKRIEHSDAVALVVPLPGGAGEPDWTSGEAPAVPVAELETSAPAGAVAAPAPPTAARAPSWRSWEASFKRHLRGGLPLELWRHASSGEVSNPGEGERELRIRISELARGQRSARLDSVRQRFAKRAATVTERVRKAQQSLDEQEAQLRGSQTQTAISIGATVLSALLGRRAISHSSLGRATTAARGFGRSRREKVDVEEARRRLAEAQSEMADLERQMTEELATAERAERADLEPLERLRLLPKEVEVGGVALLWRWSP